MAGLGALPIGARQAAATAGAPGAAPSARAPALATRRGAHAPPSPTLSLPAYSDVTPFVPPAATTPAGFAVDADGLLPTTAALKNPTADIM